MKWTKSKLGENFSDTAIMSGNYHIAKFTTYINGEKVERYLLSDCSSYPYKSIKWFDKADDAKEYCERILNDSK